MKYGIANVSEAEKAGIKKEYHNTNKEGTEMVLNENEYRWVKSDDPEASTLMFQRDMTLIELDEYTRRNWK